MDITAHVVPIETLLCQMVKLEEAKVAPQCRRVQIPQDLGDQVRSFGNDGAEIIVMQAAKEVIAELDGASRGCTGL